MKRIVIILFCIGICSIFFRMFFSQSHKTTPVEMITPSPTSPPLQTIRLNAHEYAYEYFTVSSYETMTLVPNFKNPVPAETLIRDNECIHAINAGFYSKTNTPIGLWKNDIEVLGYAQKNMLLNGFYSIKNSQASIMYDEPTLPRIAFQTGPILIIDSALVKLAITNDEPARRMITGITNDGVSVFFVVYDPLSPLRGPYLNDLPSVIDAISKRLNVHLQSAINLDGGSASAFYSNGKGIWELNPVGSILCVK